MRAVESLRGRAEHGFPRTCLCGELTGCAGGGFLALPALFDEAPRDFLSCQIDLQRLHVVNVEAGNEQINTRRQVVISAVGKASLGQVNRE